MANCKVDWVALQEALPVDRTVAAYNERMSLFNRFDGDGTGRLSVDEVVSGVHEWLNLDRSFNLKPFVEEAVACIRRADQQRHDNVRATPDKPAPVVPDERFNTTDAAKATVDGSGKRRPSAAIDAEERPETSVDRSEFRLLLLHIHEYLCLWRHFCLCDLNRDMRVSEAEFKKALPMLQSLGLCVDITDGAAMFRRVDVDRSGSLTFDEFADFVLDYDVMLHSRVSDRDPPSIPPVSTIASQLRVHEDTMTWAELRRRLPFDRSSDHANARGAAWEAMENASAGRGVTLFALDAQLARLLGIVHPPVSMKAVWALAADAVTRLGAAKDKEHSSAGSSSTLAMTLTTTSSTSSVARCKMRAVAIKAEDFRTFLHCAYRILELLEAAAEVDLTRTRPLPPQRWERFLSIGSVSGVFALGESTMADVDSNGDGVVTFDEYCSFAVDCVVREETQERLAT